MRLATAVFCVVVVFFCTNIIHSSVVGEEFTGSHSYPFGTILSEDSAVFFISLAVAAMFVVSSIKGSFVSIGRNPMASASIHKGMVRVAILAVTIIVTGAVVSYTVLVL